MESSIKLCEVCFVCLGLRIDIEIVIRYSKFQIVIQSFLQRIFYHNSAEFSEIWKCEKNYDLSFNSLNYYLSWECGPLLLDSYWFHQWPWFHNRSIAAAVVVESTKVVLENQFSACSWMAGVWVQDPNCKSVFSSLFLPLFLPLPLFLIKMLLLDLLPSKLILILKFKIFQTNFNDNLRWRLMCLLLNQNR